MSFHTISFYEMTLKPSPHLFLSLPLEPAPLSFLFLSLHRFHYPRQSSTPPKLILAGAQMSFHAHHRLLSMVMGRGKLCSLIGREQECIGERDWRLGGELRWAL